MRKTDILDVMARKLSPYMFLFGFYLVTFGDSSPGGGFQGGAVIASGIILIAMTRGTRMASEVVSPHGMTMIETVCFGLFIVAGLVGVVVGVGFLGNFFPRAEATRFIFLLNALIGLKVASGISLICLLLFREGAL